VNNLLGSASINIVLLALADAAMGRDALTAVVARPSTMMQAALCMMVLALVAIAVTSGDILVFGVGLWSAGLFVATRRIRRLPRCATSIPGSG
jgi:cation:H+ antiporter